MKPLTRRLQTALDLLPVCHIAADIGCDHGIAAEALLCQRKCQRVRVCVKGVCLAVIVFMFLLTEDMEKLKNPAFRARKKRARLFAHIFFHPDCTVGPGIATGLPKRLAGYTAGGEFHPALKTFDSNVALL